MNNKGFTLIELLAVIVLLALISSISVFAVSSLFNNSKDKAEKIFKEELSSMIEDYITLHASNYRNGDTMTLQGLIDDGMTTSKDLINPKTNVSCDINKNINVKRTDNRGYCFIADDLNCIEINTCKGD